MIGFFDSGVGGLTILEHVRHTLPDFDTLYLGDTAHAPYGNKAHDELVRLTWAGCEWLFAQGCELIIIACNTASATALREIQQTKLGPNPKRRHAPYGAGRRILGVIRPTVEAISKRGHRRIVVLSTKATAESRAYPKEFEKLDPDIRVISHACPNWAPMIEEGKAQTPEMREDVEREVRTAESEAGEYDAVLLACTHYPYVKEPVEEALSRPVPVYAQGELVAESLRDYLRRHPEIEKGLSKKGTHAYFTTGDPERASRIASERFGFNVIFRLVR